MWGELSTALLVGLALVFYAIAGYHTILIFLGLRMTRGGPKPFDKGSLRNPVDLPSVSIVIPARDEEIVVEGAVRCADRLQYPKDLLQVLLVEDGSVDATPAVGRRLAAALPNVQCLSGGLSKGKPLALNRAIAHARGDVIAVFDSDTRYQPDLLLRVAKYFHDHPDVSVVQAVPRVMNQHTNAITRLNYYETRFWFQGLQAAKERFGLFMHLAGTGMFLRRSVPRHWGRGTKPVSRRTSSTRCVSPNPACESGCSTRTSGSSRCIGRRIWSGSGNDGGAAPCRCSRGPPEVASGSAGVVGNESMRSCTLAPPSCSS